MDPGSRKPKDKHDGVDARRSDYARYDQVEKRQDYRFAERAGQEEFDDVAIRTCDLSRWLNGSAAERRAFADELGSGLEQIGFAVLAGHGVAPELYAACEREVERLFTGHSLAEKLRFRAARHGSVNQGYFPIEETTEIHPDQVEGWVFCRRAFDLGETVERPRLEDFWPDPAAERVFRDLCRAHDALILPVMRAILTYLGCAPDLYDERLTGTNIGLRLNYYPPLDVETPAGRLLGHEDVDLFTFLPAPTVEGLQVLDRRTSRWIRLDPPPGALILNTGDYMQRITNDRLPSTTHRVSQPTDPALRRRARVSFPMNVYLNEDELLEVLPGLGESRYAPVRAIEFHTRTTALYYGDDYAVPEPGDA